MILETNTAVSPLCELPPLAVESMTLAQLAEVIPQLVTLSMGRTQPAFDKLQFKPPWWPEQVPWTAPAKQQLAGKPEKGLEVLKQIVRSCYRHMGQESLLQDPALPTDLAADILGQMEGKDSPTASQEDLNEDEDCSVWICFVCAKEFDNQDDLMSHQEGCEEGSGGEPELPLVGPLLDLETKLRNPDFLHGTAVSSLPALHNGGGDCPSEKMRNLFPPVPTMLTKVKLPFPIMSGILERTESVAPAPVFYRRRRKLKKWSDNYHPPPLEEFVSSLGLGHTPKVEEICKTPKRTVEEECEIIDLTLEEMSQEPQTPRTPRSLMSQWSRDESSARKRQLSFTQAVSEVSSGQKGNSSSDSDSGEETAVEDVPGPKRTAAFKSALLAIDLSSPLGQRLKKHLSDKPVPIVSNIDEFCRTKRSIKKEEKNDMVEKLRHRPTDCPVTFKFTKKYLKRYCHSYKFNRADRIEFQKRLKTGLDREGRRLLRLTKPCSVKLKRLSVKTIKYWTTPKPKLVARSSFMPRAMVNKTFGLPMTMAYMRHKAPLYSQPVQGFMSLPRAATATRPVSLSQSFPTLSQTLTGAQTFPSGQGKGPVPQLLVRSVTGTSGPESMRLEVVPILNHTDPSAHSRQRQFLPAQQGTSSPKREFSGSQKRKQVFENVRAHDDEISIISLSSDDDEEENTVASRNKVCCSGCTMACKQGMPGCKGSCKVNKPKIGPASFMRRMSESVESRSENRGQGRSQSDSPAQPSRQRETPTSSNQSLNPHTLVRMVNGKISYASNQENSVQASSVANSNEGFVPKIVDVFSLTNATKETTTMPSPSKSVVSVTCKTQLNNNLSDSPGFEDYEVIVIESDED